ncbi:phosphoglycerate mutase-like protein [Neolentinus lepideus HHB14362 ss-1]|uniref:Phosphoglycerate mutase-like protein n=1 Tax=Neolentinus lepideus HHB14362 ss-1 TaxID=1314782 RepID=A0A165UG33_9AGAM|nr:phosphoglycerate mutase-like protein [Neolentinus lepideus HHB14362 ss-1]
MAIRSVASVTLGNQPYACRPPQVALDVENYPVAPEQLELEQVHIYIRHGERTPVGVRMAAPPASIPEHWMLCQTARRFREAVASSTTARTIVASLEGSSEEELQIRRSVERSDGTSVEGECLLGELTDVGRQSTYNFGSALRDLYINKLKFLPETHTPGGTTYFRSTNMPRTIESLQQIVHGLYPTSKCAAGFVPHILVRNGKDENLLGNTYACKRLEILQVGFARAAAAAWNHTLEPLDKKVSKYIGGNPIRIDGKPRASGILDTVRAAVAHGIKVPPEFEEKGVLDVIEKAVVHEWFADKTEEVRRLGMGRLLTDLTRKIQTKVDKGSDDPLKILVHSTHDTAIAALCQTLDVFDDKWPAFTASITFELFKTLAESDVCPENHQQSYLQTVLGGRKLPEQHYIRMRYQNKNMVLPICADEGKHLPGSPEFCTLEAFNERVKELKPADWEAECAR